MVTHPPGLKDTIYTPIYYWEPSCWATRSVGPIEVHQKLICNLTGPYLTHQSLHRFVKSLVWVTIISSLAGSLIMLKQPLKMVSLLTVLLIISMLVCRGPFLIPVKLFNSLRAAWSLFTAASVPDTQLRNDLITQVWNRITVDPGPFGLEYTTNLMNYSRVISR